MLYVSGSISANTGLAPQYSAQFALAANVIGVVMTSSTPSGFVSLLLFPHEPPLVSLMLVLPVPSGLLPYLPIPAAIHDI